MIRRNNGEKSAKLFAGISMIVFSIIFCSILVCMVNIRQGGNSIIMKEDSIADLDNGIILEDFDDEFDEFDEFSHANNAFNFVQIIFLLVGVGIFVIGIVLVVSALKKRDNNANDSYFNGVNMNSYYTNMNSNMNSNMNPNMNTNMNPNMNYNTNTQYNMNDNYRMNDYQNNNQNNTYILNGKKYSKDKNSLDI